MAANGCKRKQNWQEEAKSFTECFRDEIYITASFQSITRSTLMHHKVNELFHVNTFFLRMFFSGRAPQETDLQPKQSLGIKYLNCKLMKRLLKNVKKNKTKQKTTDSSVKAKSVSVSVSIYAIYWQTRTSHSFIQKTNLFGTTNFLCCFCVLRYFRCFLSNFSL